MTNIDDFLEHHGVIGMHWGKHLPGRGDSPAIRRAKKKAPFKPGTHPEHSRAHTLDKKPINQLSNNELKAVNARLELEQKVSKLRADRSPVKQGQKHVKETLALIGTATAAAGLGVKGYKYFTSPQGKALVNKGLQFIKKSKSSQGAGKLLAISA